MKYKSAMTTQASGSVDGMTAAHNRGGRYMRARTIPVNPSTAFQSQVRNAFTNLVNLWGTLLSQAQRDSWETYGQNVPVTDALGDAINLSGQNWFIGANTPRLQAQTKLGSSLALAFQAPPIFDRGEFTTPTVDVSEASGIIVSFDSGDDWTSEDGAAMLIYQGRAINPSVNFYKGPYRLIGEIAGDSVTPPTNPTTIVPATLAALGYPVFEDQFNTISVAVVRADGRYSSRRKIGPQVVVT